MKPKVCVIVLNWNGTPDTIECLESLQQARYEPLELLVVDNGSTDSSVALLRSRFPEVCVLETGRNLGYAGGNNIGLEHAARAGADYLFVLNNDTQVDPGCIAALVEAGEADPAVGAVGCFVYADAPPQPFLYAGLHAFSEPDAAIMGGRYDTEVANLLETTRPVPVDSAHGCGFAIKRAAYAAVGGFDTRFFAVHEEVDWCMRAREAGYKIVAMPSARIWHKVGSSFGQTAQAAFSGRSPGRLYYDLRNLVFYYGNRTRARRRPLPLRFWRSFARCVRQHYQEALRANQPAHAQAILEAGWHGLLRRSGPRREAGWIAQLIALRMYARRLRRRARPSRLQT